MYAYFVRRLLYAVLTFIGITIATFALIHSVPGDPVSFYAGFRAMGSGSAAARDALRHEYFLDRPLPEQYFHWVRGVVTLDFGRSIASRRAVSSLLIERLPNTLILNGLAFAIAALIGIPIGLWSGARNDRLFDRGSAVLFFLLYSLPAFWVALLLMQFFSVRLQILPLFGMRSDQYELLSWGGKLGDRLAHLTLPVVTLAYAQLAIFARFARGALREVIRQDFVTTARAKGAGEGSVIWHHAFRNALLPLITLIGLTVPYLMSGSVIVEEIFQWNGVGLLYFDAIRSRDYPTVMALTVLTAVATLVATLIADLLYGIADPRIRLEGGKR